MTIVLDKTSVPPSSIDSLEAEIQQEADSRIAEVILALVDKLEKIQTSSPEDLLRIYVAFKLVRHHFKKHYHRDFVSPTITWEEYDARMSQFKEKILIARRNYYAAKHYSSS